MSRPHLFDDGHAHVPELREGRTIRTCALCGFSIEWLMTQPKFELERAPVRDWTTWQTPRGEELARG